MIYIADENDEGLRLDIRLAEFLEEASRSKIQAMIKSGNVLVNNENKKSSYRLKENDEIEISDKISEPVKIEPQNIELDIIYEDDNMLVINKPKNMLTHPTSLETRDTLVNALLYKYGNGLSDINGDFRRGIVHRLDRNTSGLIMVAKSNDAHYNLAGQIKNHKIEKVYRAIVKGNWEKDEETIDLPIGRNPKQPHKMMVTPDGKDSKTIVKVIKRFDEATAVELTLITGRTHQIRVHTSFRNHPVYNDTLYGAGRGKVSTTEQVLQSFKLTFTKPFTDEIITLQIPPDEDYEKVYKYYEGRKK